MSVHSEIKKITTETLLKMKADGEKITMLTLLQPKCWMPQG